MKLPRCRSRSTISFWLVFVGRLVRVVSGWWGTRRGVAGFITSLSHPGRSGNSFRTTSISTARPSTCRSCLDYVEALYAAYDEDWANRFIHGSWDVFEGQVYPMFDRNYHVLPADFKLGKDWPRFRGVDHGWSDPTACVWMAADFEGNFYVYDVYYRKLTTIEDNSKAILERSGGQVCFRCSRAFLRQDRAW
jgi:hypothetical protein